MTSTRPPHACEIRASRSCGNTFSIFRRKSSARKDDPGYSAFAGTDLQALLRARGVRRLFVGGLATDCCVLHTVRDALSGGVAVVVLRDAVRAFDVHAGDGDSAIAEMQRLGASVL